MIDFFHYRFFSTIGGGGFRSGFARAHVKDLNPNGARVRAPKFFKRAMQDNYIVM